VDFGDNNAAILKNIVVFHGRDIHHGRLENFEDGKVQDYAPQYGTPKR
jgi:hypothetical protein